jgi:hypothetical protein
LIIGRKSYLQSGPLNWLDFILALMSVFDLIYYARQTSQDSASGQNAQNKLNNLLNITIFNPASYDASAQDDSTGGYFRALRAVRVVRALRQISQLGELKVYLVTLTTSFDKIATAGGLIMFAVLVTSIAGVQLFSGVLHYRCVSVDTGQLVSDAVCGADQDNCPFGTLCISCGQNPSSGSADNVIAGTILVLAGVTLVGWSQHMSAFARAAGRPAAIFFLLQVFVLSFYLANVFLAIVVNQFEALKQRHVQQMRSRVVSHWLHRGSGGRAHAFNTWKHWAQAKDVAIRAHFSHKFKTRGLVRCRRLLKIVVKRLMLGPAAQALGHWKFLLEDLEKHSGIPRATLEWEEFVERRRLREKRQVMLELQHERELLEQMRAKADMYYVQTREHTGAKYLPYWDIEVHKYFPICLVICSVRSVRAVVDVFWYLADRWGELARGQMLENFTLSFVVLNTITMALDHTRDSDVGRMWGVCAPEDNTLTCAGNRRFLTFTMGLQATNLGCICMFAMEMFIKVVGLGVKNYFSILMNVFDASLVVISLVEVPMLVIYMLCLLEDDADINSCSTGGSGLTVLRALRLVRLTRLLRKMPNIRKQIRVLSSTLFALFSLCLLLLVLVVTFASVGTFVFGGKMQMPPSRSNIFLGALVWVWGPGLPERITEEYPGVPARVRAVDLKLHPHRPLGVDLLTSFGDGKRVVGHQWVSLFNYKSERGAGSVRTSQSDADENETPAQHERREGLGKGVGGGEDEEKGERDGVDLEFEDKVFTVVENAEIVAVRISISLCISVCVCFHACISTYVNAKC